MVVVYASILGAVGYALYKERQALGCPDIPNGTDCDNINGKAVKGTTPSQNDSNEILFNKIKQASSFADKWVTWRIAFLASVPSVVFIYFFVNKRFPTEQELMLGMFVITTIMYFCFSFYKFHLIDYVKHNITKSIDIISKRC